MFPNTAGRPIHYSNWLQRGWAAVLERAGVRPRNGDAQKALRRTYVTSSLVCGRNPNAVAGDLSHATARMVTEVYDSFLDPASWPGEAEQARLIEIYGWADVERRAPQAHPPTHGSTGVLRAPLHLPDIPMENWGGRGDSNPRLPGPQPGALTN